MKGWELVKAGSLDESVAVLDLAGVWWFARRGAEKGYDEDGRAARYRAMYDDLGLSEVAYPDGTLEANWSFGAAVLLNDSDKSKNKHASRHFHATEHPLVQSFQPDEDWIWCFVDEVVIEPTRLEESR